MMGCTENITGIEGKVVVITGASSGIAEAQVQTWGQMIDVNIKGLLYGIAAALPIMQKQGFGHVINVASVGGLPVTPMSPLGATVSELAKDVAMDNERARAAAARPMISSDAIAQAISYAIAQPADVNVAEMIVRPSGGF